MKHIYLDIDGVLLTKNKQPAKHLNEFLKYVTDNYQVYWLTTHCKGDSDQTITFLKEFLDTETLELAKMIKPTNWTTSKTEAIDFTVPFLWLDDYIFEFEKAVLIKHSRLSSWIHIDLLNNPNQLSALTQKLDL